MPEKHKQRTSKWPLQKKKVSTELIHIARVAKLIRTVCCCGPIYMQPDRSRFNQLSKFIVRKCIITDTLQPPGKRNILNADLETLKGYELDIECPLAEHLDIQYQINIGKRIDIYFPAFIPAVQINNPSDATHCRLIAVTASLDFGYYSAVIKSDQTLLIQLSHEPVHPFTLQMELPQPSHLPIFIVLGLSYCNEINLSKYCQAVRILHIENANPVSISSTQNTIP
ncbi:hypothetical protein [Chitinophaga sp. LS1]|uniref:hypothetical protein n=1 Tax=Chitinophaga sp. LS1 TaxID=3051176 RepID=UPI002AABFEDB|nr:hypothetical protein [Chitinophaga sp. LS1]WPV67835.1 hypothetical protein QQL36_03745 [Chitinophaga sp. LS1]